jgi:replicative DNA helicase
MALDKTPHSVECEMGALSAMWRGGPDHLAEAYNQIHADSREWFHIPAHGSLYDELMSAWHNHRSLELVVFTQNLRDAKKLDEVGGAALITQIHGFSVPAMLPTYLSELSDKRWLRRVIRTGTEIMQRGYQNQNDVEGTLREVEHALLTLSNRHGLAKPKNIRELTQAVIESLDDPEKALGISTGFEALDALVGGFAECSKVVLAGKTSGGKSALAATFAESLAVRRKHSVAIFTFEMSARQYVQRIVQIHAGISARSMIGGKADMFKVGEFAKASEEVADSKLSVFDERLDIAGIRARCIQIKPRVAIIDYLQIVPEKKQKGENTTDKFDRMSNETKQLAHQLGITVIELSQLTFDEKHGTFKTRSSSGITNDADQLWVLEGKDDEEENVIEKRLAIAKQREGPRGHVDFKFEKPCTRFIQKN